MGRDTDVSLAVLTHPVSSLTHSKARLCTGAGAVVADLHNLPQPAATSPQLHHRAAWLQRGVPSGGSEGCRLPVQHCTNTTNRGQQTLTHFHFVVHSFANPSYFACVEREFGVTAAATMVNDRRGVATSSFAGVVFTRVSV